MNNGFEYAKKIIKEYEELQSFYFSLSNKENMVGVIYDIKSDSPGINYKVYSEDLKKLFLKIVKERMEEIESTFN